jgi:phosphate:Na+ symporter
MNENVKMLFGLLGGLALFLYGMTVMSESLQKAAGEKMKKILALLTKNPVLGVLSGALVTAVLQSSSATTVMIIGFISAGLMTLPQGISVIFGANIGTTMTAQIIAFKLSDYIYIIIFAGFMLSLAARNRRIKSVGDSVFSFGVLFLGIDIMGNTMKPLASSPVFLQLIHRVADAPVLGTLVGTMMTLVVQSSSATIAVLQNIASQPAPDGVSSVLGLAGAIPILLGDNIGTTITAVLASLRQSRDAKRAAAAHCIFNLSGTMLFLWFVKPYASFIAWLSPKGAETDIISRQIANAHTGFNVTMVLIWTPLLAVMVRIVMRLIPDKTSAPAGVLSKGLPSLLSERQIIGQPTAALTLAAGEIDKCAALVSDMFTALCGLTRKNIWETLISARKTASEEHELNQKTSESITSMFADGVMSEEQASLASGILFILGDIDRMNTLSLEILENIASNSREKKVYSKEALRDLRKAALSLSDLYARIRPALQSGESSALQDIHEQRDRILHLYEKMRSAHVERVGRGKCSPSLTASYSAILQDLDRIGNSCVNLADTVSGSPVSSPADT